MLLHRAVALNDINLVKYLLSIGASNSIDDNGMYPVLYSLSKDDDEIFNILIKQVPIPHSYLKETHKHFLKYEYLAICFFKGNPVAKIITLFEKGYFSTVDDLWLRAAVAGDDDPALLNFLLSKLKEKMQWICLINIKMIYCARRWQRVMQK